MISQRSYDSYCDLSRQYDVAPSPATLPNGTAVPPYKGPSLDTYIKQFGRYDLLNYSTSQVYYSIQSF